MSRPRHVWDDISDIVTSYSYTEKNRRLCLQNMLRTSKRNDLFVSNFQVRDLLSDDNLNVNKTFISKIMIIHLYFKEHTSLNQPSNSKCET